MTPFFSIIIPVYNGGPQFRCCLQAIQQQPYRAWELIVVDDGSTDDSAAVAAQFGAQILHTAGRQGPAAARNLGAQAATADYLFFTDADCQLHADTLARAARILNSNPQLDALFGSYDDAPHAPNFVAQYKNLFHHYVHQTSAKRAVTFWAGCGAIKRDRFLALNGFNARRYPRPAIEDIELGCRLTAQGGQIRLAKGVQVKHLKRWTLLSLLKSDIFDRGIPWTQLILRTQAFSSDLNLQTHNRVSVMAVYLLLIASLLSSIWRAWAAVAGGMAALLLWLNRDLYRFFQRKRGLSFTMRAIPLHWLYYFYNAISFGCGLVLHLLRRIR